MARGATIVVENNFTKGLVTEFTAFNFPENAVTDGDNVVFSENGSVTRRMGIDFEAGQQIHRLSTLATNSSIFRQFLWESVGTSSSRSFCVQQIGDRLHFFEVSGSSLSDKKKSFTVNLRTRSLHPDQNVVGKNACQFTSGKGYLFVAHPYLEPFYIEYDEAKDTITTTNIKIEVRDFERIDDGLDVDKRPSTLSNKHKYNLYNQGWYIDAVVDGDKDPRNVLTAWKTEHGDYPSNADIWWVYKDGSEIAYFGQRQNDKGRVGPSQFTLGNTPSPNGHYIYSAWNVDRTGKTNIASLPKESSGYNRPQCIAFFAGRIFYAGISADKYSDRVYFSQIIESDDQIGKCYQLNDPTSETIFDLLDTDGGIVRIPLIGKVISMRVINDSLLVLGTKGVFAIRGTDNGPFRATDYSVEFISNVPVVSDSSIVSVDSSLIWWNYDAIYAMSKDNIGVSFTVENVSKQSIQSVIDDIPSDKKLYVTGAYNRKDRIVQWLYSDRPSDPGHYFNRILELNVVSKAFYTHTINTSLSPRIVGIFVVSGLRRVPGLEDVVDNNSVVVTTSSGIVQSETMNFSPNSEIFKYPTSGVISSGQLGFTYSEADIVCSDWKSVDTTGSGGFTSYFYSGYRVRGEMLRKFNSTPIAVVLKNVKNMQVTLKGIWDYGLRTTTPQTLQWTPLATDYIVKRVKLRGKGRALQLNFESVGTAPFDLSGWSTFDTGGQQP